MSAWSATGPSVSTWRVLAVDDVRERVLAILDVDVGHLARVHPGHELAEADLLLPLARLQDLPDREEHHDEQDPEQQRLVRLLHVDLVLPRQWVRPRRASRPTSTIYVL